MLQNNNKEPVTQKIQPKKISAFYWHGIDKKGKKLTGTLQGESAQSIKALLRKQGLSVTSIKEKYQGFFAKESAGITSKDMAAITRQMSTMLTAGVPLMQSLWIIAGGHQKNKVRSLLSHVAAMIESGMQLSDALRTEPVYFDELYCNLVQAGEQ